MHRFLLLILNINKMAKQYIGSDEHWIDSVNQKYDENEEHDRQQQKEIDKQINEQIEKDYYNRQPHEGEPS